MQNILFNGCRTIALVGSGGTPPLLATLGHHLSRQGQWVCITTTGRMPLLTIHPQDRLYQVGTLLGDNTFGPGPALSTCLLLADYVLVQADGLVDRPLSVPAPSGPLLPEEVDLVLWSAGLQAIGQPLDQCCHRPKLAAAVLRVNEDHVVTPQDLVTLALHPQVGRKHLPTRAKFACILTGGATQTQVFHGLWVQKALERQGVLAYITPGETHSDSFD